MLFECFISGTPITQPRERACVILPSMAELAKAPANPNALWHWLRKACKAGTRGPGNDHKIHAWKRIVETDVRLAMKAEGLAPADFAIAVDLVFVMPRPKSRIKKTIANLRYWFAISPDIDNLTKAVFDALNKHAWIDDKQIVSADVDCFVAGEGDEPGVAIRVSKAVEVIECWADHLITQRVKQEHFF